MLNISINKFLQRGRWKWKKLKILTIKDGDEKFQSVSKGNYGFELDRDCRELSNNYETN